MTEDDRAPFALDQFLYLQVARPDRGPYPGGIQLNRKMPGRPEMCRRYGVGAGVMEHAWRELKQRGLIVTVPGHGSSRRSPGARIERPLASI